MKFTHGLTDEYLGGTDQSTMEGAFAAGMNQNQKMDGSKQDPERVERVQGAGLNQPVSEASRKR